MSSETFVIAQPETPAEKPADVARKEQIAADVAAGKRPAWLPENFDKPEDFAKSFGELQGTLTRTQQELAKIKGAPPAEGNKPVEGAKPAEGEKPVEGAKPAEGEKPADSKDGVKEMVEKSGVDITPYQKEFDETGALSEKSLGEVAKSFEPQIKAMFGEDADTKRVVSDWIEGQKARTQNYRAEVFKAAGGEEAYKEMVAWASTALSPEDKANYSAAANSGDLNAAKLALDGLIARYTKANGKQPSLLGGEKPAPLAGFASSYEMAKAMEDPRYGKDPVYTQEVVAKTIKSNF